MDYRFTYKNIHKNSNVNYWSKKERLTWKVVTSGNVECQQVSCFPALFLDQKTNLFHFSLKISTKNTRFSYYFLLQFRLKMISSDRYFDVKKNNGMDGFWHFWFFSSLTELLASVLCQDYLPIYHWCSTKFT